MRIKKKIKGANFFFLVLFVFFYIYEKKIVRKK